jgi:3-oxoacyl-(acyl-carrier-protein) synthase
MTAPHPDGRCGASNANCLRDGFKSTDVDDINTHGTSTPLGTLQSLKAISKYLENTLLI